MLAPLLLALLQAAPASGTAQQPAPTVVTVKPQPERDSTTRPHREKKPLKALDVTAEHLATAYRDAPARDLLSLARVARTRQDSALLGYDATTFQRISAGVGFSKFGRDRLAFRSEQATKVQWRRGIGAYVDVTGSRMVVPIAGKSANVHMDGNISPIPYYPGSETLWIGSSIARENVNENDGIIHPLANGAEAYYTYATGDSATFRLPDGKSIRLRELKVRPRSPKWNLAVGSLWFDLSGGQLVRAAYRMSVPMDIKAVAEEDDPESFEDVPALIKPMLFPMTAQVSAIGVEYGLYQGRFWLPRLQVLEGGAHIGFMRVPVKLEQTYKYENVNAGATLAPIPYDSTRGRRGGTGVNVNVNVGGSAGPAQRDSMREARRNRRRGQCDSTGTRTYSRRNDENPNPILTRIPCDSAKLANSPDLPPSIYDKGEETFDSAEIDALVSQALSMGAQADFAPQRPVPAWDNMRYNRIEGLSVGGHVEQQLGAGYSARASGRIGVASLEPLAEVTGSRSDLRHIYSLTAYNRLVSASDWGNPLSLGSSISAFVFGRDEGFYYRTSGVELSASPPEFGGSALTWSVFAEQDRTAKQKTTFSLARLARGSQFEPNFDATRGIYLGARTRYIGNYGLDPAGLRLFSDLRLEGARGDSASFGRVALDLTASHSVGQGAVALTVAGGTSVGLLPPQRHWYMGGTQTVRGQRPGIERGDAFWLARGEIGLNQSVVRPVLFADFGWAGDRRNFDAVGIPMSGAGAGFSIVDGLVRFDVARGINPDRQWRVDTYVDARF